MEANNEPVEKKEEQKEQKKEQEQKGEAKVVTIVSKKIQINSMEHELAKDLVASSQQPETITGISIEGNSYSLGFSESLGGILKTTKHLQVPLSLDRISTSTICSWADSKTKSRNQFNSWPLDSLEVSCSDSTSATMQSTSSEQIVFSSTSNRPPFCRFC